MSDANKKIGLMTTLMLTVGTVVIVLFDELRGVWNGTGIEFDAPPDQVAEHAVISGRADLLPLLTHQREELIDVNGDGLKTLKMVQVVYNPLGRPIFQEIIDNAEATANAVLVDERLMRGSETAQPTSYVATNEGLGVQTADGVQPVETEKVSGSTEAADAVEFAEKAGVFGTDSESNSTEAENSQAETATEKTEVLEIEQIAETEKVEPPVDFNPPPVSNAAISGLSIDGLVEFDENAEAEKTVEADAPKAKKSKK